MVNITQCAVCGKVIPATENGCAYCESERPAEPDRLYLALPIRLLLMLFGLDLLAAVVLSTLGMLHVLSAPVLEPLPLAAFALRWGLALLAFIGLLRRGNWAWRCAVVFVVAEIIGGSLGALGFLPGDVDFTPMLAPLWTLLFVFLLVRNDVRAFYDRSVADRREVLALLDSMNRPEPNR